MIQSALMTSALVQRAFEEICPEIEDFIKKHPARNVLCLQVLDPCVTIAHAGIPQVLLHAAAGEHDPSKWKSDYMGNAFKKARIVWRTGHSTHVLKTQFPHLFEAGDFKYGGGIIRKGIIVGASGLTETQDATFALRLAEVCHEMVLQVASVELAKPTHHILESTIPK